MPGLHVALFLCQLAESKLSEMMTPIEINQARQHHEKTSNIHRMENCRLPSEPISSYNRLRERSKLCILFLNELILLESISTEKSKKIVTRVDVTEERIRIL